MISVSFSPWRILEDAGGAFAMGGIGGSLWHGIKGFKNSPRVRNTKDYKEVIKRLYLNHSSL